VLLLIRHCFTEQHKLHGDDELLHMHSNRLQQQVLGPVWLSSCERIKVLLQPPFCLGG
jgi:hypothetical protein